MKKDSSDTTQSAYGPKLKELREQKGLTLREVEKLTGVSNSFLSQVESGKRSLPSIRILNKLAKAYGSEIWKSIPDIGSLVVSDAVTKDSAELWFIRESFPKLSKEDQKMFIEWLTFKLKQTQVQKMKKIKK